MANKRVTLYLHGKVYWAKILGSPRPNFQNPVTLDDVKLFIQKELNEMFCIGEDSGARFEQGRRAINPDPRIEEALLRIEKKIDEYFIDNR